MYSKQVIGSLKPFSLRCTLHRKIHFAPNSVLGPSSGMKLPANASRRPTDTVPTICSAGMSTRPMSSRPASIVSSKISSSTCGYGYSPRTTQAL